MATTFEEFMAQGLKNTYQSGVQVFESRPLAKAFEKGKPDSSKERMAHLKKMLSESKTGKQTLDFLKEKGTKVMFEKMDYYGYFSPDKNIVALNPAFSDEDLAVTFVHEVRHAWQSTQLEATTPELTPNAFFKSGFMIEADACASEVTYAHEMREKNPKLWEAHQQSPYAPMSTEFEKTLNETGDEVKARESALLKWYDLDRIKPSYSNQYAEFMAVVARELKKQKEFEPQYFAEDRPTKKMVQSYLKDYDGNRFVKDAKQFDIPERLNITEKDAVLMCRGLDPYMKKYNRTAADLGLDKITVKKKDGTTTTCETVLEEVKAQKAKSAQKAAATRALHAAAAGR